jgi:hypothetical protein
MQSHPPTETQKSVPQPGDGQIAHTRPRLVQQFDEGEGIAPSGAVVGMARENGGGAVELFGKHNAGEAMR